MKERVDKMLYKVEITETLQTVVEVTATTEQEALSKVQEDYNRGNIILSADDFDNVEFNVLDCEKSNKTYADNLYEAKLKSGKYDNYTPEMLADLYQDCVTAEHETIATVSLATAITAQVIDELSEGNKT